MEKKFLTLKKLAEKIIGEEKRPLTPKEIWEIAQQKGYSKLSKTAGKTPWKTIGAYLYVDMRNNEDSLFIKYGEMPRRFFLKELLKNEEDKNKADYAIKKSEEIISKADSDIKYKEIDLHPFLVYYADAFFRLYTKTINHSKSTKKKSTEWLHPDIVGILFPFDYIENDNTIEFAKGIGSLPVKLYSFEIKRKLDSNNIREAFFQTVSNSSWANEGYLVAAEILDDPDFNSELARLSAAFGIGIIELNIEDPDSTEVLYQAKLKDIDYLTMSKLSEANEDFRNFIDNAKDSINLKKVIDREKNYDKVFSAEELIENINKIIKKNK